MLARNLHSEVHRPSSQERSASGGNHHQPHASKDRIMRQNENPKKKKKPKAKVQPPEHPPTQKDKANKGGAGAKSTQQTKPPITKKR